MSSAISPLDKTPVRSVRLMRPKDKVTSRLRGWWKVSLAMLGVTSIMSIMIAEFIPPQYWVLAIILLLIPSLTFSHYMVYGMVDSWAVDYLRKELDVPKKTVIEAAEYLAKHPNESYATVQGSQLVEFTVQSEELFGGTATSRLCGISVQLEPQDTMASTA